MSWFNKKFSFSKIFSDKSMKIERVNLFDLRPWVEYQFIDAVQKSNFNETFFAYSKEAEELSALLEKSLDQLESSTTSLNQSTSSISSTALTSEKKEDFFGLFSELFSETRHLINILIKIKEKDPQHIISFHEEFNVIIEKIISRTDKIEKHEEIENKNEIDDNDDEEEKDKKDEKDEKILPEIIFLKEALLKIKDLQQEFSDNIKKARLEEINSLFTFQEKIYGYTEEILRMEEVLKKYNSKLSVAEARKDEKENRLSLLSENPDFLNILDLRKKKSHIISRMEKNSKEIIDFFSKLNEVLKKYNLAYSSSLVEDYFKDPVSTLQRDESLSILHIFNHLKAAVSEDKLNLNEEEKNQYIDYINLAQDSYLEKLHRKDLRLRQLLGQLEGSNQNKELLANLEDIEYRRKHFMEIVTDFREKIQFLEEEINIKKELRLKEKRSFQNIVKEVMKKEIIITIYDINTDDDTEDNLNNNTTNKNSQIKNSQNLSLTDPDDEDELFS